MPGMLQKMRLCGLNWARDASNEAQGRVNAQQNRCWDTQPGSKVPPNRRYLLYHAKLIPTLNKVDTGFQRLP